MLYRVQNYMLQLNAKHLLFGTRTRTMVFFGAFAAAFCVVLWLFWPEISLFLWGFDEAEVFWKNNPRRSHIIVSLTTLPHRINALDVVLKSILLQSVAVKEIRLNLPLYSQRDQTEYDIPAFIRFSEAVSIVRTERDWGPATKFIPTLLSSLEDQPVVFIDDDVIYPRHFIESYLYYSERLPDAALATRGWDVPRSLKWADSGTLFGMQLTSPQSVDVVTGCGSVLVKPRFFDKQKLTDYETAPKAAFFVDDIWVSGQLALNKVERYVIPVRDRQKPQLTRLSINKGLINNENKGGLNNDVMLNWFKDVWHYEPAKR